MRKKGLFLIALLCYVVADAQVAKWLIHPEYDRIEMLNSGLFKVSQKNKFGLLDAHGAKILEIAYDSIAPFQEDRAVLFHSKEGKMAGFTDLQGHVVDVSKEGYRITNNYPYFSSGYLLVEKENKYYYLNKQGKAEYGPFAEAYPFFDGKACIRGYKNLIKNPEDTYYDYLSNEGKTPVLRNVETDNINFLSSFNNGQALLVIKKKFYLYTEENKQMVALSLDNTTNKKSLVSAFSKELIPTPEKEGYSIAAKNGTFTFDSFMRLSKIAYPGKEPILFPVKKESLPAIQSIFESFGDPTNSRFGIRCQGKELLPPQFDKIILMKEDKALVYQNNQYGVITVDKENSISFKLNNNEHIGFTHQYFVAKLAVSLPSYMKCSSATVVSKSKDCEIQIETRTENENIERNTLGYDCRLSIPEDLSDTLKTHTYHYALKYDGLVSIDHKVSIPEWYVKYYEVNLSKTNFSISPKDTVTVEFDLIKTDVARNDETNYFKNVELIAANFPAELSLNKITENHYSFRLYGIEEDRLSFSVKITEVGWPPIEYPFEMVFVKPNPRARDKKTTVTITAIRKKEKEIILPK